MPLFEFLDSTVELSPKRIRGLVVRPLSLGIGPDSRSHPVGLQAPGKGALTLDGGGLPCTCKGTGPLASPRCLLWATVGAVWVDMPPCVPSA